MTGAGIVEAARRIRKYDPYWQKIELIHIRVEFGEDSRIAVVQEMERMDTEESQTEFVIVEADSES